MEFEVPKRHILRPTLSTDTVQRILRWERQKGWSSRRKAGGPWQTNVVMIMNFLGEEKMNTREWSNLIFFFQIFPFWTYIKKHIHFLVHGHSSWSTFNSHLVRGPKTFYNWFFLRNWTMEVGPWKSDHEKRPSYVVRLHGPWFKPTLSRRKRLWDDPGTFHYYMAGYLTTRNCPPSFSWGHYGIESPTDVLEGITESIRSLYLSSVRPLSWDLL
jgi:hypothetical protein